MNSKLNQNFRLNNYTISYEQWQVLSRLYEQDGLTQSQLAIKIERDQGSISRLIDNMLKQELVTREPNENDRRVNHIYLTDLSNNIREDLEELALKTISQATQNMSKEQLQTCLQMLDQIRDNLE
ncbi:MarR family winged helix-turn-helix transcriptional regulator [Litchfieldia alkalitelluris]|uniref:MarR family winged helix-turn-helix transcriptional regulator n=1 Tax=Litchfieldia alkalitelluris TaxID=304268 RepID=UPI000996BF10|nr:MarR family transcriptional regulator [Litchfieldia alkalitelluris]